MIPLVQSDDILDIPENALLLVEDVHGNVTTGLQLIELVRDERLHLFDKLLLSTDEASDQLTWKTFRYDRQIISFVYLCL